MNIAIWIIVGGVVGWVSCTYLDASGEMGPVASIIVGALGGFAGGNIVAPMLGGATDTPNEFSMFATFAAVATAGGVMALRNFVRMRFDY